MIIPSARRGLPVALAVIAALGGTIVAIHYHRLGLTLSHYDARGHLVVARRIIDSLTPGWQQIGAVWLPLPHLLNALPVQVDAWYRSGASAVAISIASFAIAVGAISWIVLELTGSSAAAVAGTAVFALNPNVLYLQATPMTEPLLLALMTLAVAMLVSWCRAMTEEGGRGRNGGTGGNGGTGRTGDLRSSLSRPSRPSSPSCPSIGWVFALACLTRYEAWPVTLSALAAAVWARWRRGDPLSTAARRVGTIALFPIAAIGGFLVFSRVVIGQWFVASGFFTPENKALGDPMMSAAEIWYGLHGLSGFLMIVIAAAGAVALLILGVAKAGWSHALVALSLAATAALPWLAFIEGHPFRIRYVVPLIAIEAIGAGVAAGLVPKARLAAVVFLAGVIVYELRPLDLTAPMVVEAQWDRPNVPVREQVTACLRNARPGEKIMASMGSLGHYMQETARAGFDLRDFLHEGNGDIWLAALATGPRPFAEWVLIEEKAEGGDMLAIRAREQPQFLDGYSRVCEGAGVALYKRKHATTEVTATNGASPKTRTP